FILLIVSLLFFFFFQAEDGIRDRNVTGVQTCALPICTDPDAQRHMLEVLGYESLDELLTAAVPSTILLDAAGGKGTGSLESVVPAGLSEPAALAELRALADRNTVRRSLIGLGYHGTHTPAVIQRNVLENPAWYTAYTPYQPEISQGRLEALLTFQTMICDLTGMDVSNASTLDES